MSKPPKKETRRQSTSSETELYSRDELIEAYLPLIQAVAGALASRLPSCVDADDLISVGVMGLIDAIKKYDPEKCDNFKNYARIRIKGAMLDELRSLDWVPRSVRQVATQLDRQRRKLEQSLGRNVRGAEIAEAMDVSDTRYHQLRARALGSGMIPLEDIGHDTGDEQRSFLECLEDPDAPMPDEHSQRRELLEAMGESISHLSEREQAIIALYYSEGMNLKEIGVIYGVTESRVSQIHSKAIKTLRQRLGRKLGQVSFAA